MKSFERFTSFFAWLQIVASPALIGLVIAFIIYSKYASTAGLIMSIIVAVAGLTIGIVLATKIWKRKGTVNFMAKISTTPEIENPEAED